MATKCSGFNITDALRILVVPVLSDNYAYLVIDREKGVAAAVDPAEPAKLMTAAAAEKVRITTVLTTHNHWDHAGGNEALAQQIKGLVVYGGKGDRAAAVTNEVGHGDAAPIAGGGGNVKVSVLFTPCHTPGHVCYVVDGGAKGPRSVFTGDTLFVAGCGNFNAGTPKQMHTALCQHICGNDALLPPQSLVWVGHNYTRKNLAFAQTVEPGNAAIAAKIKWCEKHDAQGLPTVPSTVASERATNPFVRVGEAAVQQYAGAACAGDEVKTIASIRKKKSAGPPW